MTYTHCPHATSYEPTMVKKGRCYSCRIKAQIGKRISVVRFGRPVEYSVNHATGECEAGMSVYEVVDGAVLETIRSEFAERSEVWIGTGELVGSGSDDEPLVVDFVGRKATKRERTAMGLL